MNHIELFTVGAFPTVVDLAHVVDELFTFTKLQPVGRKVPVNPSVNGKADAIELSTVMYAFLVSVSLPFEFVATNVTVYVPGVLYVTEGFVAVEVPGVPPAKVHE